MSNKVTTLVFSRVAGSSARKAVLCYMADKASDEGQGVFVSKQTIASELEMGRSTVIRVCNEFVNEGILEVVGSRKCANGATVEYDLCLDKIRALPSVKKPGKGSQSGTSPDRDPSQSGTPPVPERDPKTSQSGTQTILEPSLNHITPHKPPKASEAVMEVLTPLAGQEAVASFLSYRRQSRHKGLTVTGAKRLAKGLEEIAKAGASTDDALAMAEERGWATVKPDWYFREVAKDARNHGRQNGSGAAMAQRAGERFASRHVDKWEGSDASVTLLPAGRSN